MRKILMLVMIAAMAVTMCACREASKVSYNLSKEADNFNIVRRLTVFDTRTDTVSILCTPKSCVYFSDPSSVRMLL